MADCRANPVRQSCRRKKCFLPDGQLRGVALRGAGGNCSAGAGSRAPRAQPVHVLLHLDFSTSGPSVGGCPPCRHRNLQSAILKPPLSRASTLVVLDHVMTAALAGHGESGRHTEACTTKRCTKVSRVWPMRSTRPTACDCAHIQRHDLSGLEVRKGRDDSAAGGSTGTCTPIGLLQQKHSAARSCGAKRHLQARSGN